MLGGRIMTAPVERIRNWVTQQVENYTLIDALRGRRSRRFGLGMEIPQGPFTYKSQYSPQPLTEEEEAALIFAGAGITGYILADLAYGTGEGGNMLAGMMGRTAGSADSIQTVALFVINDEATYYIKRPQNIPFEQRAELIDLAQKGELVELYRRLRVKIANGRTEIPIQPGINFNINKWSVYAKGGTYFVPVNDLTSVYINGLLEIFEPEMGLYAVDERNLFLPAGLAKWGKRFGGHLNDDFTSGKVVTIQGIEMSFAEALCVEQGGILQNIGLMGQALGLGGFANYARNEYHWLQALGFTMETMSSPRYAGAGWLLSLLVKLIGQSYDFPYAVNLKHNGETLLQSYAPPNYPNMEAAVRAFVDYKFGVNGAWRKATDGSLWKDAPKYAEQIKPPSEIAIQATIDFCTYCFKRYGRFPVYSAPFRTIIGYQATHVDVDFYDQFYHPEALSETQRERFKLWEK
jgi:hypothetical protein